MSDAVKSNEFTILDWIGIVYIVMHICWIFYFSSVVARFGDMFQEWGGSLPMLSILTLKPWFLITVGIISLGMFLLLWHKSIKYSLKKRRAVIVISFVLTLTASALCAIGIYLPVLKLASPVSG